MRLEPTPLQYTYRFIAKCFEYISFQWWNESKSIWNSVLSFIQTTVSEKMLNLKQPTDRSVVDWFQMLAFFERIFPKTIMMVTATVLLWPQWCRWNMFKKKYVFETISVSWWTHNSFCLKHHWDLSNVSPA